MAHETPITISIILGEIALASYPCELNLLAGASFPRKSIFTPLRNGCASVLSGIGDAFIRRALAIKSD